MKNETIDVFDPEITLRPYLEILWKHKITLALVFLLAFLLGVIYLQSSPKMYRASMMVQAPFVFGGNQTRPNIHMKDMVGVYLHFLKLENKTRGDL